MAIEQKAVQTHYRRTLNQLSAGMIANNMPTKCGTGRLVAADNDATYKKSLPFGYAVGWIDSKSQYPTIDSNGQEGTSDWDDGHAISRVIERQAIGELDGNVASQTSITNIVLKTSFPLDQQYINKGSYIKINDEVLEVDGITYANGKLTLACARAQFGTTAAGHTASTDKVYKVGGRTNFAGVAVVNVALPGANSPVDTYNVNDLVTIGTEGDYVVVCDNAVNRGDLASIRIAGTGTNASKIGMFSNKTEVGGSAAADDDYVSAAGAIFMTSSQLVTPYSGGDAKHLAVLRVSMQPR